MTLLKPLAYTMQIWLHFCITLFQSECHDNFAYLYTTDCRLANVFENPTLNNSHTHIAYRYPSTTLAYNEGLLMQLIKANVNFIAMWPSVQSD